ncbi:glycoside hydrolase family 16 protein [Flavobacterium sp. DGU11]|uniref:Glycoside hydrolase family 16 protein n=1 Tax=Flavobacterium arundinis TaxID=3139143 RepID=A0ABU9HSI3_9FLAO
MTNRFKLLPLSAAIFALSVSCAKKEDPVKHSSSKEKTSDKKENVVFFDDFSGTAIDTANWTPRTDVFVNNEQQAYADSSATLYLDKKIEGAENGALMIKALYSPEYLAENGKKFDFISGRMDSRGKKQFTYGTMAARIKMPPGSGYWPAFWALGAQGNWPDCGEIDIMEYVGEPDWIGCAMHGPGYFGDTHLVNKVYLDGTDVSDWHIYSVDWTKDQLLFKVDGKLFYRVTKPIVNNYGPWVFDKPHFLILNFALGGAYPAKINGVKTPYNGIPQSTVDDIKKGNAKVYVDWVKVTK